MLEINTTTENDILLVDLEGVLDSQTASDFKSWIEEKIIEGYRAFGIGCHQLKYISSRGIGALIELQQLLQLREGRLSLYRVRSEVQRLLDFLKLTEDIPIYLDSDEAIDKLQPYHRQPQEEDATEQVSTFADEESLAEQADEKQAEEDRQAVEAQAEAEKEKNPAPTTDEAERQKGLSEEEPLTELADDLPLDEDLVDSGEKERPKYEFLENDLDELQEDLAREEVKLGGTVSTMSEEEMFLVYDESEMVNVASDSKTSVTAEEEELISLADDEPISETSTVKTATTVEKPKAQEKVILEKEPVLSNEAAAPQSLTPEPEPISASTPNQVFCPNCGAKLRVKMAGKYLCPSCRVKFQYPFG